MKIYYLNNELNGNGSIEFRANGDIYALVSHYKDPAKAGIQNKTIILNQREALNLYQALQDEILNKKEK